jgi:inorganic phosphate transporter, PiT family
MFILIITIGLALVFDIINGFHDAANSIATIVSTRVLKPSYAVLWAAFFNFVAIFVFAPKVANSISKIIKIQEADFSYIHVVLIGVLSAIIWNLLTWWWKLPTSSSHALIGGISGAGFAYAGWDVLRWDILLDTIIFIVLAPVIGFVLGFCLMLALYWIFKNARPAPVDKGFRKGQFLSAALYSIGHGANDAQKTMGIIMALLLSAGIVTVDTKLSLFNPQTAWIVIVCQAAMSLGTALGGWRIVKTMGMKITKLKPIGGFCAETAGASTLFLVSYFGIPVSTTHTITGAIVGVGSLSHKPSNVKWNIAARIIWAWILTIPASAAFSYLMFTIFYSL